MSAAATSGVDVAVSSGFMLGEGSEIGQSVSQVAASGARIILCVLFDLDLAALASAVESQGLLKSGYVWLIPGQRDVVGVIKSSPDPEKTRAQLTGWMTFTVDQFHGGLGERFNQALDSEPFEHLDHPVLGGTLTEAAVLEGTCGFYCGVMYDAVWTAAIAISRMQLEDDGTLDKAALLTAIRTASFEGATGRVEFEETGERGTAGLPLLLRNVRALDDGEGGLSVAQVLTWQSTIGPNGAAKLDRMASEPPIWPGGERGWDLPHEVLVCEGDFVFSAASLQCEPCPRGTAAEGNECVRYDASVGVMVPLRWGGQGSPLEPWALRYAAAAVMAAHHINQREAALVPRAEELLPANFKLVFDLQDSMALPSVAVKHVVAWQKEGRHAIIGSYRSAVTGPLALAASIEATPVISYSASASSLSDRDAYPTLSRTVVNNAVHADRTIKTISSLGWTRVAILYVNDAWGRYAVVDEC